MAKFKHYTYAKVSCLVDSFYSLLEISHTVINVHVLETRFI